MNFKDFLTEVSAGVYKNSDHTLVVISDLVQKKFKLTYSGDTDGICLLTQAIFSMSAVSGIPAQDIADSFDKDIPYKGLTFKQIFDHFKKSIIYSKGNKYKFNLSLNGYDNINSVIKSIEDGQPVVMIIKTSFRDILGAIDDTKRSTTGKVNSKDVIKASDLSDGSIFHAELLIGYDVKEKYLIGREIDHKHGFKGFFKIKAEALQKNMKAARFFGIVVDSFKEVK